MGGARKSPWVIGTALLAVLLLAGAWFLLISPSLDEAASNRAQAQTEQDRIDLLKAQLASLQADFERIDDFRDELAELRGQVPGAVEISELTRQIDSLAARAGISVLNVSATSPTLVSVVDPAAQVQAEEAAAAAADTAAVDELAEPTTDAAAAAPPAPATEYYAVPVNLVTYGDYQNTLSFIDALQTENPRLVLVTDLHATRVAAAGSTGGRPAVQDGALETRLSAYVIVVPTAGPEADETEVEGDAPPLPVPAGQPNPFIPPAIVG